MPTAVLNPSGGSLVRRDRSPGLPDRLRAHLRGGRLDRQLAAGIPPWSSPVLAARALQITGHRHRRGLARSLELLVERAETTSPQGLSAAVKPCREQVLHAIEPSLAIAARLRSGRPVGARGVAWLRELLSDGSGPCYTQIRVDALTAALQAASIWLDVND
jgi:hypothetical protein